jgi:hypothetical protein
LCVYHKDYNQEGVYESVLPEYPVMAMCCCTQLLQGLLSQITWTAENSLFAEPSLGAMIIMHHRQLLNRVSEVVMSGILQ